MTGHTGKSHLRTEGVKGNLSLCRIANGAGNRPCDEVGGHIFAVTDRFARLFGNIRGCNRVAIGKPTFQRQLLIGKACLRIEEGGWQTITPGEKRTVRIVDGQVIVHNITTVLLSHISAPLDLPTQQWLAAAQRLIKLR